MRGGMSETTYCESCSHFAMSFSRSKPGFSGSVMTGGGFGEYQSMRMETNPGVIRRLTTVSLHGRLLLLLPRLLRLGDEVLPFVYGVVLDVLVVGLLECPAVRDTVEYARE